MGGVSLILNPSLQREGSLVLPPAKQLSISESFVGHLAKSLLILITPSLQAYLFIEFFGQVEFFFGYLFCFLWTPIQG